MTWQRGAEHRFRTSTLPPPPATAPAYNKAVGLYCLICTGHPPTLVNGASIPTMRRSRWRGYGLSSSPDEIRVKHHEKRFCFHSASLPCCSPPPRRRGRTAGVPVPAPSGGEADTLSPLRAREADRRFTDVDALGVVSRHRLPRWTSNGLTEGRERQRLRAGGASPLPRAVDLCRAAAR